MTGYSSGAEPGRPSAVADPPGAESRVPLRDAVRRRPGLRKPDTGKPFGMRPGKRGARRSPRFASRAIWPFIWRILVTLAVLIGLGLLQPAIIHAQSGQPATAPTPAGTFSLRDVGFDPHLNAQVPLSLVFHDETGKAVRLADYVHDRPILLSLNDFTCQDLCPLELQNLVDTMDEVPFRLGTDYAALAVSINPVNTAQDATVMHDEILHRYSRPDAPNGAAAWHFVTGDQAAITQLTQAVGFRYAYDALNKDYAHPVGAILLTPDGHIARYLYGMDFPANDLRLALAEAAQGQISTPVEAVLLLCYHYDVATGRYTNIALGVVRAGGVLTLAGIAALLGTLLFREYRNRDKTRQLVAAAVAKAAAAESGPQNGARSRTGEPPAGAGTGQQVE